MSSHLVTNIGELLTNDPTLGDESMVGRLVNAAIVIDDGVVAWVGSAAKAPSCDIADDVMGAAVLPGYVDSHTHLVFAGERSDEFEARMAGRRYDGGGIRRTVAATTAASRDTLLASTRQRLAALRRGGVTTVEMKSGYALTVDGEARLVSIATELADEVTFLGAHVVPEEYATDREGYVALVAGPMMAACDAAAWVDVFCDQGAFSVDEARHILTAAKHANKQLRLHGNQLGETGGVGLAVEMGCASVDHCTHVGDAELALLGASSTVATLLPSAEFSTKSPYPDAQRFLDAGVTVALATDCNPGTSYVTSMGFVIALAVREMGMTVDQAAWSATMGGARALRRSDVGHLGVGARGDVVVVDAPRVAHVAYRPGSDLVAKVIHSGHRASAT
jgi:imidazolonepropionase